MDESCVLALDFEGGVTDGTVTDHSSYATVVPVYGNPEMHVPEPEPEEPAEPVVYE